ncbi:Putative transposase [Rubripirellula lacrimiformis]|uniref:Transposase n=1 Tax=Rubripirellula lacrimiformis TaxID=1930273 RepID=A0A517N9R3_9BACT|nr:Putative transposase [Rubripirellula lacrimiformis]
MLAKLALCRTHVLGGRKFRCVDCDEITSLYNSCGDRHCPQCSGGKRVDFHDKATKLILPGVTYYQVVFTLPSELSELALANRYEMADLLVDSAWKSLSRRIKAEQDYDPAAMTVLHTWNQKLEAHWHVHMLVPGAGPGLSTHQWTEATAATGSRNSDGFYLVDADPLREAYREQAIGKLRRLRSAGKLKLVGKFEYLRSDENWDAFVKNLESKKWVAYIQPPPSVTSSACQVVRYLVQDTPKPSWAEIFWREDDRCPGWYADRQRESHRRLWTASYGTDFYDWYVETQVESAEGIEREPIAMVQLPLAGFTGDLGYPQSYLVGSF